MADNEETNVNTKELRGVAEAATGAWPVRWTPKGHPYIARDDETVSEHLRTFDPPTVLALLDVADAADGAAGTYPDSDGGREAHGALIIALDRLRDV